MVKLFEVLKEGFETIWNTETNNFTNSLKIDLTNLVLVETPLQGSFIDSRCEFLGSKLFSRTFEHLRASQKFLRTSVKQFETLRESY